VSDVETVRITAESPTKTTRAPADILRLGVGLLALVGVLVVGLTAGDSVSSFVADLLGGLRRLPSWLVQVLAVLAHLSVLLAVALPVVLALRHRSLTAVLVALAAGVVGAALAVVLIEWVDVEAAFVTGLDDPLGAAGRSGSATPAGLAALTAVVASVAPWVERRVRWLAWAAVLAGAASLFLTSPIGFGTVLALLTGWVVGTAAVVLTGTPSYRPTGESIAAGLAVAGVPLQELKQASLDARGSTPYFATAVDGTKLFVKALGADERSADLMFRAYRRLQPRDLGDEKAFSSLRRAVEHEALVAFAARDVGVRTPRVVAFASAEPNGFVLAYEAVAGRSLDRVPAEDFGDDLLDGVWEQLVMLRRHQIAHRDLRLANVFLGDDGALWMIDFGFSELAASELLLANDLAELIASSSTIVGPERAVAAASRAVGADSKAALTRLQLPMLSGATRTALKADPGSLERLRATLTAA
jgi:glycosyltransferase 2 family protein